VDDDDSAPAAASTRVSERTSASAEADDDVPEEERAPPDWLADLKPPPIVHYEIRHGGSMKNVANLFKIYHPEITALNPGVDLEAELAPGTKLVVYRHETNAQSESIGLPSAGSLQGGSPMVPGPGRQLKAIPWKAWGTAHSVATLDRILRQWAMRDSNPQPILVGNLSARQGGRLEPHSTHQSGRDVDLGYIQRLGKNDELEWREATSDNLDAAETWTLLELLRDSGKVEVIYIDRGIQKLLHEHAVQRGISKAALGRWMEYPRPGAVARAFIQHVPGHTDHLHVRFSCTAAESRCKSRR
jgi:murein endopeptidase